MIVADGQSLIAALQQVGALEYTGWASQAAAAEDLTQLCPGGWVQPGASEQRDQAGQGRHVRTMRAWIVVLTVASDDGTALEEIGGPLVEAVRDALSGLAVGDEKPPRHLRYVAEMEPYYEPGYMELPLEFELSETFRGDTQ